MMQLFKLELLRFRITNIEGVLCTTASQQEQKESGDSEEEVVTAGQ